MYTPRQAPRLPSWTRSPTRSTNRSQERKPSGQANCSPALSGDPAGHPSSTPRRTREPIAPGGDADRVGRRLDQLVVGRGLSSRRLSANEPWALCEISIPYFLAADLIRRHAASRSDLLTSSTWLNLAIALGTCRASVSGSLRSLGNANFDEETSCSVCELSGCLPSLGRLAATPATGRHLLSLLDIAASGGLRRSVASQILLFRFNSSTPRW